MDANEATAQSLPAAELTQQDGEQGAALEDVTLEDFQQLQRQYGLLLQHLQDAGIELPPELEEEFDDEPEEEPLDEGIAKVLEAIEEQGLDTHQVLTLSRALIGGIIADIEQSLLDATTVSEDGLEVAVSQDDLKGIAGMADASARLMTALDILHEVELPEYGFEDPAYTD